MAYSSVAEEERHKYIFLEDVAEVIAACGDEPITREALVTMLVLKVFENERGWRHKKKFLNICLGKEKILRDAKGNRYYRSASPINASPINASKANKK